MVSERILTGRRPPPEPRNFLPASSLFALLCIAALLFFSILLHPFDLKEKTNSDSIDAIDERARLLGRTFAETNARNRRKLVCYFNYPSSDDEAELAVKNVDPRLCTHLNVAFAAVRDCALQLNEPLKVALREIRKLKETNRHLKVLLSVGGATVDDGFSQMIKNHTTRKIFIKTTRDVLREYELDGIDIDWEFPVFSRSEKDTNVSDERLLFTILLIEIRREFDRERKNFLLSVAVAAQEPIASVAYDIMKMNEVVDFVNIMTYDFHFYTKYTPFTGFNSPLYPKKEEALYLSTLNINYSVEYWIEKGMSEEKIIVGLPTFGHSFQLFNPNNNRPGSPSKGFGKTGNFGFVNYPDVCQFIEENPNVKYVFDNETFSPYVTFGDEWISYEDEISLRHKVEYIKNRGLGGVMIYSLNADDFSGIYGNHSVNFTLSERIRKILYDDEEN